MEVNDIADPADTWRRSLAEWAIPQDILDAAPESPWGFPTAVFTKAAQRAVADPDRPSRRRALAALDEGGSVLDVGVGGGAASLPLAPPAALLVGVDESEELLASFAGACERAGVAHREVHGSWPAVAPQVERTDVVVCHHVFYNVPDLVPFAAALTHHARRRVVVELTDRHPLTRLNPLWKALHGIDRPSRPTADDAEAVLVSMGLEVGREEAERPSPLDDVPRAELVTSTRRRLCVGPERDAEIDALLGSGPGPVRRSVTLWWDVAG